MKFSLNIFWLRRLCLIVLILAAQNSADAAEEEKTDHDPITGEHIDSQRNTPMRRIISPPDEGEPSSGDSARSPKKHPMDGKKPESSAKRPRNEVGILPTRDLLLILMQRLHEGGKLYREDIPLELNKLKIHKMLYFISGLHYALTDRQLLKEPFLAFQHGAVACITTKTKSSSTFNLKEITLASKAEDKKSMEKIMFPLETLEDECKKRESFVPTEPQMIVVKELLETVYEIYKDFPYEKFTTVTHEGPTTESPKGSPWYQTWDKKQYSEISPALDREFFTSLPPIERRFVRYYTRGLCKRNRDTQNILQKLMEKYPDLADFSIKKMINGEKFDGPGGKTVQIRLNGPRITNDIKLLKNHIGYFVQQTKGFEVYDDIFRPQLKGFFVHPGQTIAEGVIAHVLSEHNFGGKAGQLFDPSFQSLVALAAGFKSIPALYYLSRIFETFSQDPEDELHRYYHETYDTLQKTLETIPKPREGEDTWQPFYAWILAISYKKPRNMSSFEKFVDRCLTIKTLPDRYKEDLLKRAFSETEDNKYIKPYLHTFPVLRLMAASSSDTDEEAMNHLEQGILKDIGRAFFKAGKSILLHGYPVKSTSNLWTHGTVAFPKNKKVTAAPSEKNLSDLGERLLEKAIKKDIEAALILYVKRCEKNFDKALKACSWSKRPWALYQRAKIKERQYDLEGALKDYKDSGPLLGYLDAARLSTPEKEKEILQVWATYKKAVFEALYSDSKRGYLA